MLNDIQRHQANDAANNEENLKISYESADHDVSKQQLQKLRKRLNRPLFYSFQPHLNMKFEIQNSKHFNFSGHAK